MQLTDQVFSNSDPIAERRTWNAAADYASQVAWQNAVCGNLSADGIISAGIYFGTSPMSIAGLAAVEGSANRFVKEYCSHNYPQWSGTYNLTRLMHHGEIASQISGFAGDVAAARAKGKPHIFGETNSGKPAATGWDSGIYPSPNTSV